MQAKTIYEEATRLIRDGFSVIPILSGEKKPAIKWEEFQNRIPTQAEIDSWFSKTNHQMAIVTGNVSRGRFVLDFDGKNWDALLTEFMTKFPDFQLAAAVTTGSGKIHLHAFCPNMPPTLTKKTRVFEGRGSVYWMNYTWQGKQIRKPCRTTNRTEAQRLYEESDSRNKLTFDDLIIWYLNHPIPKRRKTYHRFREMTVKLCDYFEGRLVEDIKPVDVERFQDWMLNSPTFKGAPYKPKTVNLHVALLKRMFNLAVRDELVERNPCWKVAHLPVRNVRDRIVSPEEFEALKDALPQYNLILTLGYYLGMRRGEILTLKDTQIHFYNGSFDGYIHLTETKNGDERLIPFDGEIGRRLVEQMTKTKEGRLFYPKRGKSVDGGFRIAFDRACKRLGIDGRCFHDFRHTAITNMRKAGVDTSVIMAISGHKTLSMFQRYNKVDMDDKMEALNRLNRYFGAKYEPHALTD